MQEKKNIFYRSVSSQKNRNPQWKYPKNWFFNSPVHSVDMRTTKENKYILRSLLPTCSVNIQCLSTISNSPMDDMNIRFQSSRFTKIMKSFYSILVFLCECEYFVSSMRLLICQWNKFMTTKWFKIEFHTEVISHWQTTISQSRRLYSLSHIPTQPIPSQPRPRTSASKKRKIRRKKTMELTWQLSENCSCDGINVQSTT